MRARRRSTAWCLALTLAALGGLAAGTPAAGAAPAVLLLVTERVMGVFDTAGYEQPRHVEALLATALGERGLSVVDLEAVERATSRAKARQLLEGDELAALEVALQQEAEYLLVGSATSKSAGGRMFGTNMQSLQANVTVRLIRSDDGRVIATASAQASQAHLDEVQGGILALSKATEAVLQQLSPGLDALHPGSASGPRELALQIKGLVSYRHLDYLVGYFQEHLPGVRDARLRGFHGGLAEIALTATADAETIARAAVNARFTGFRLRATHVAAGRIELEAVLEE